MKKVLLFTLCTLLMLSSCGTYTGAGAYTGSTFGSILGSAIGGIAGGARGSDIGTIVGMAGGAVVGAAIGSAADKVEQQRHDTWRQPRPMYDLQVCNARLIDTNRNGILTRGETCTVQFEIMNVGRNVAYNVEPVVLDVSRNRHLHISPNLRIERIAPGKGIRYTATIRADNRLKNGHATIRVGVAQGPNDEVSQWTELIIATRKR